MKKQYVKSAHTGGSTGDTLAGKIEKELHELNNEGFKAVSISCSPSDGTTLILYEKETAE